MVPEETAKYITENLDIPTIGIGGGKYCSGQVLVTDDMLSADYILPDATDKRIGKAVAQAVIKAARETGVARI